MNIFKEFGASGKSKNNSNNDILGIQMNRETVSDDAKIKEISMTVS